ncbi:MAG: 4-oxalocrotonate tautomerase [Proteobacteria bacterium]|nr:4-oxalocrotonate tautomerase [Pseudomonadota bacterium]
MPIVQIHLIEGRTAEQKRALVRKVTDAVCNSVSCPPEAVHIILSDMKRENYAEAGIPYNDKK